MGWVFLSGPMGSGKTTVGRALASALGARFVDLDARIEATAGASVTRIFRERGEPEFRALEREVLSAVLDETAGVVALGGGTVTDDAMRRGLLERGELLTLSAPLDVLARRVGSGEGRPLLGGRDPAEALASLIGRRRAAYAECHAVVSTDRDVSAVVGECRARIDARALVVPLGERTYRVEIRSEARGDWAADLAPPTGWLIVSDSNVAERARRLGETLDGASHVILPPGEAHKSWTEVDSIWSAALARELDRDAVLVGVGGGVIGDLTGFAAATYLRGVRFVTFPTSLLAMVDASVGGKTGFDRPEGKNLIGAFHQPSAVHAELSALDTLPREQLSAGFAEVIKAAWLDSDDAVAALERDAEALMAREPEALDAAIRASVSLKIRIVASDEREQGARRLLNLGHTVGHALEAADGYAGLGHGQAVGLGMLAAFDVAAALGDARADEHRARLANLLARFELPTDLASRTGPRLAPHLRVDKKRAGDRVRYIVPGAPGCVEVRTVPIAQLERLFGGVSEDR
ncbi:MAG: 3-dehydroquinate synthase [Sandaracinaceae bacterium]